MTGRFQVTGDEKIPPSACIGCGVVVDMVTGVGKFPRKPRAGQITICLMCGHVMAFADDMALRDLTDDEMVKIAGDPRLLAIQRARGLVVGGKAKP